MAANLFSKIFIGTVGIYFFIALFYFLGKPPGGGDEALFIADLSYLKTEGFLAGVRKGVSLPYLILSYPLSLIVPDFIALRTINILLFGGLIFYFYKRIRIKNLHFYTMLLFFYSTVGYYMSGTNDTLFSLALTIFFIETYLLLSRRTSSFLWWGLALIIAVFTRALILLFIPSIVVGVVFIIIKKRGIIKTLLYPLLLALLFLFLNIPSLQENGTLSYDQKKPPFGVESTWPQRQYLAQLLVNQGKLSNYQHPSWAETDRYLKKHGNASLPATLFESVTFDISLTVKEFFKELYFIFIYGFRQLAFILPTLFFLGTVGVFKLSKLQAYHYIPIALLMTTILFSTLIISFMELRWFAPLFIAGIFIFFELAESGKLPKRLLQANYIMVTLLSIYGCYGLFLKF